MKVTYIVIGLEVLDDGQIFSCIARRKKRYNCVCKYRQTEETKTKTYIFVYKIFTVLLKATQPGKVNRLQSEAITK